METVTATSQSTQASKNTAQPQAGDAVLSSDFETFLTMLTAQMQNQDPLNPVEASEFAVQLATFSSVEQQVRTNELLETLTSHIGGNSLQSMGSWVGMEALVNGAVPFDGSPVSVHYDAPTAADKLHLIVRNADGAIVDRTEIDAGQTRVAWDGIGLDGTLQDPGLYRFSIEPSKDGVAEAEQPVRAYVEIEEVRLDGSDTILRLASGEEILSSLASGLRAP
ncbi:MAG: flagellin biosynthesis protein FlgD [Rhodobacteraceae bacterium]|nr:flagellin biosynthesis protein FlgD [Paracoccaceae bacterium]